LLIDCGAITDDGITYAALILFGTRKALNKHLSQSEVSFEYRSSEAAGPAQQRADFRVGFFTYYDKVWELVNLRNDMQNYQDGLFVLDVPMFNERVIRETLLNAACHRNYQLGGTIFVKQFRERIVFESPGGFPTGISPENIIHKQFRRNRLIADILALCGLIERSGQGMDLIYELSIREGKPLPDFKGSDNYFVFITLNGKILDKNLILLFKRIDEEILNLFTTDDFLVIDALFHGKRITRELRTRMKHLSSMGIVEHIGFGNYNLSEKLFALNNKPSIQKRLVGADRERIKEHLYIKIKSSGTVGIQISELVQMFPNLSREQIKNLLRDLKNEKKMLPKGKANKARWFIT
jgi:ATP-dependent DNA helicase RecG